VYLPNKDGAKALKFDGNGKFITKWGSQGDNDKLQNQKILLSIQKQAMSM